MAQQWRKWQSRANYPAAIQVEPAATKSPPLLLYSIRETSGGGQVALFHMWQFPPALRRFPLEKKEEEEEEEKIRGIPERNP